MRILLSLAIVAGFSFLLLPSAVARPVTTADLSGKTICWANGNVVTYLPGGKQISTMGGEGTWRVTAIGVEVITQAYSNIFDDQILPDGTYASDTDFGGKTFHNTGHICK
jgi:hypothetical protein